MGGKGPISDHDRTISRRDRRKQKTALQMPKIALQCGLHDCYKIDTVWARAQNFKIEKPAAANC